MDRRRLCGGGISQRQRRLAREKRCEEECICRETSIFDGNKCLRGKTKKEKNGFAERVNVFCRGQVISQDSVSLHSVSKMGIGQTRSGSGTGDGGCRALMAGGLNGKGGAVTVRARGVKSQNRERRRSKS